MGKFRKTDVSAYEKPSYCFKGYRVTRDGKIYDVLGNLIVPNKAAQVKIVLNGRNHFYLAGRVVWQAVTGEELEKSDVIVFKDGNPFNAAFDNLSVLDRRDYFKGHEWKTQKISNEDREKICQMYYHPEPGQYRPSYIRLSEMYHVSLATIENILRKYRKEHGLHGKK